jgi:ABC-2 type transport system ATP-binding protein
MTQDSLAELSGVSKRFGKVVALDGLDLQVRRGELFALLGPNGAGKTTAISLLLGLQRPDVGTACLFGQSPLLVETRREVGVMMQEAALAPELRVREQIDLVASYYPNPMTPVAAMEMTRTEALADRPYGKLSGGQKRQVQFAIALCGRPKLLFLDEPTVGLDVQARAMMWSTLRRLVNEGSSIILTTHYLEEAEVLADRVAVLAKGRMIASGSVNEMRALVVRKRISCSTSLSIEEVRTWPDVESATRDHQGLHITAGNAESVVRELLAADENLQDLEVRRAGLAEAFTELTQETAT